MAGVGEGGRCWSEVQVSIVQAEQVLETVAHSVVTVVSDPGLSPARNLLRAGFECFHHMQKTNYDYYR